jgi:hypothetical protein
MRSYIIEWLEERRRADAAATEAENLRIANGSLAASQAAAAAARDAAVATKQSARWTMWAAIAAAASAAISLWQILHSASGQ